MGRTLHSKGSSMRMSYRALSFLALAVGIVCFNGCSQTNEESLAGKRSEFVPNKGDVPEYTDYGDMMQKKTAEKAAKITAEKSTTSATKKK